jgi:hypothetical protein
MNTSFEKITEDCLRRHQFSLTAMVANPYTDENYSATIFKDPGHKIHRSNSPMSDPLNDRNSLAATA